MSFQAIPFYYSQQWNFISVSIVMNICINSPWNTLHPFYWLTVMVDHLQHKGSVNKFVVIAISFPHMGDD